MRLAYLSFTPKGYSLALRLVQSLGGHAERCNENYSLSAWTEKWFYQADGLVFIGAAGIAVRAIAPFIQNKGIDPAVVVVDEKAAFAIPILSGHLGGANTVARKISAVCGAVPVITTATDINGIFAVDEWAKKQGCAIDDIKKIKRISGNLLAGKKIQVGSDWLINGQMPQGVNLTEKEPFDVRISISRQNGSFLHLIPKIVILGIGCRKDTPFETIEHTFADFLEDANVDERAVCLVTSIDLKQKEKGILDFCKKHGFPFSVYPAEALQQAEGDFTSSSFVKQITGVDNVCERSAVLGGGRLYRKKYIGDGVTMALACRAFAPDWSWQDE